jgi:beta-glucosidase
MDKSILIAGIKEVAGNGTNVLYAKGSNLDYDAGLKKSDNVWKTLHRDDRTAAELVAEALKLPTSQT